MSLVNQCPAARSLARSRSRYLEVIRPVAYRARIRPVPSPPKPPVLGRIYWAKSPLGCAHVFMQTAGSPCREHLKHTGVLVGLPASDADEGAL